jgi:hypothetical protein
MACGCTPAATHEQPLTLLSVGTRTRLQVVRVAADMPASSSRSPSRLQVCVYWWAGAPVLVQASQRDTP